jgi:2'-5' RNA ligase
MSEPRKRSVEAALDILVPELEHLIGSYRLKYDPSAAEGMPAHISINYPFLPGVDPSGDLYRRLTAIFAKLEAFEFTFQRFGRFPDVLYLVPEPESSFKELIEKIAEEFPESPPYSGVFDVVVPHLTVAHSEDGEVLKSIESQLGELALNSFPFSTLASQVYLMDNRTGSWQVQKSFRLGVE